jgi:hypothetical protein
MTVPREFDVRCLGWTDVATTGVDQRQLRNAFARGVVHVGRKRGDRYLFSLRDYLHLSFLRAASDLWMPISVAFETLSLIGPHLERAVEVGREDPLASVEVSIWRGPDAEPIVAEHARDSAQALPGRVVVSLSALYAHAVTFLRSAKVVDGDEDMIALKAAFLNGAVLPLADEVKGG